LATWLETFLSDSNATATNWKNVRRGVIVRLMPGPSPKYNWDVIRQLAATGTPLPAICKQLGVNYQTLKSRARREGWRIVETFGRAKREPPDQKQKQKQRENFELVAKSTKDLFEQNGVASRMHLSSAIRKASRHLEDMPEAQLVERHQAIFSVTKSAGVVHGWSEHQDEERLKIQNLNLFVLSLHPSELYAIAQLKEAGRLPQDASVDQMKLAIASLSESERTQFRNEFDLQFAPPIRNLQP
jgi:hypothetical protein